MGKQTGKYAGGSYLSAALTGTAGALLFFGLLLLAAGISEGRPVILTHGDLTAKACLFLSALLCGLIAGRRAGQRRLLHALTAEGVILTVLMLCALGCENHIRFTSVLVDLLLLLFGAFAGTAQRRGRRVKQRGKR